MAMPKDLQLMLRECDLSDQRKGPKKGQKKGRNKVITATDNSSH
jgi:hypothetical protein